MLGGAMIGVNSIGELLDRITSIWPCTRVESGQRAVFYRAGVAVRVLEPGIHCALWWRNQIRVEKVAIDTLNLPTLSETTTDGIEVSYSVNFVYVVTDALKKQTRVQDFAESLENLAMIYFARVMRAGEYETIRTNRTSIERELRRELAKFARAWGVKILEVGITDFVRAQQIRHMGDVVLHQ